MSVEPVGDRGGVEGLQLSVRGGDSMWLVKESASTEKKLSLDFLFVCNGWAQ